MNPHGAGMWIQVLDVDPDSAQVLLLESRIDLKIEIQCGAVVGESLCARGHAVDRLDYGASIADIVTGRQAVAGFIFAHENGNRIGNRIIVSPGTVVGDVNRT